MDPRFSSAGVAVRQCFDSHTPSQGSFKGGSVTTDPPCLLPPKDVFSLSVSVPDSVSSSADPAALALLVPAVVEFSDLPRLGLAGADSEFSLPPPRSAAVSSRSVVPLDPVSSSSYASGKDRLPPLRPVAGSLLGPSVINRVPSAPRTGPSFTNQDFPPLALQAGVSKSKVSSPIADSAPLPDGIPCSSSAVDVDSISRKPSWASLVQGNPVTMKLNYIKPVSIIVAGNVRFSLPPAVALHGASIWENTIVGFFLDKLPFSLVQSYAHRLWDSRGLSEVLSNGNGFFFFKFSGSASSSEILNGGPWYFGGRPIFLKTWKPGMNLSKVGCEKVPIWAHFYNVPLEFWTADGLSHIASTVGIPLFADNMTATLKRLSYARICIEICIDDTLPNMLELELEDGSIVEIRIDYNWVPKKCSNCREFGHLPKNCKKGNRHSWVPKSAAAVAPPSELNPGSITGPAKSPVSKDNCLRSSSIQAAGSSASSVSLNLSSAGDAPSIKINPGAAVLEIPASSPPVSAIVSACLPVSKELWFQCSANDPIAPADDLIGSGVGSSLAVDDPLGIVAGDPLAADYPLGQVAGDPISADVPIGTVDGDPTAFDDPNILFVPMAVSSVSPVEVFPPIADLSLPDLSLGCSVPPCVADPASNDHLALVPDQLHDHSASLSRLSPTYVISSPSSGGAVPSPPSSPPISSRLSRKLIMVDEVDKMLGRPKKGKKKCGGSGNSRRKSPSASK